LGPTFTYSQRSRWMKMEKPLEELQKAFTYVITRK
jgi:hypothetical protein